MIGYFEARIIYYYIRWDTFVLRQMLNIFPGGLVGDSCARKRITIVQPKLQVDDYDGRNPSQSGANDLEQTRRNANMIDANTMTFISPQYSTRGHVLSDFRLVASTVVDYVRKALHHATKRFPRRQAFELNDVALDRFEITIDSGMPCPFVNQ
jgi:hypothetical protein